jgi:hypothetical protein
MEKVLKQLSVRQKGIIDADQIKGFKTARQVRADTQVE